MAFGGIFNPNYTLLPNQQGSMPQMPQQNASLTQQGYGNSDPMALYSLYGLLGTSNTKSSTKPLSSQLPQVPTVPTVPTPNPPPPTGDAPSSGSRPVGAPSVDSRPAPPNPNFQATPYVPNPNEQPIPKPGMNTTPPPPPVPPEIPNVNSAQESGQAWMNQYTSPEYAAWYNSLAPSTRAYVHAPGDPNTAQYFYNSGVGNYNAFGNNAPWVPNR